MMHRKACAIRRCPGTLYTSFKIRPCVHLQRLSSHSVRYGASSSKRDRILGRSVAAPSHAVRIAFTIAAICSEVMGSIAVPTSQQHMTPGFMLVTMECVVLASFVKFLFVDAEVLCLDLFQSMLTKIMFALAVLRSSGPVPCSVKPDDCEADHADDIIGS